MKVSKNVAFAVFMFVALSSNAQDDTLNAKRMKDSKSIKQQQKSEAKKQAYKSKQWRQGNFNVAPGEEAVEPGKPPLLKKASKVPPPPPPPPTPAVPAAPSKTKAKNT